MGRIVAKPTAAAASSTSTPSSSSPPPPPSATAATATASLRSLAKATPSPPPQPTPTPGSPTPPPQAVVGPQHCLVANTGSQPRNALVTGYQNDGAGELATAIAHTDQGDVFGKAQRSACWFPYNGGEHTTSRFSWVCGSAYKLERASGSARPPQGTVSQNTNGQVIFAAVAHTSHGDVPAEYRNGTCLYPYGGRALAATAFSWVLCL
ncbi:hypothetical protein Pelo_12695 [Pelomyxa schiedti]|nr:hypothetical protein Pelo_12695 [Pelomyxa schiedti]